MKPVHVKRYTLNAIGIIVHASLLFGIETPAFGEMAEDKESPTVKKSKYGLNFQVPPDWPIEERAGIVAPIPIEEYLSLKFKDVELRLQGIEKRLDELDGRLGVLEKSEEKPAQQIEPTEQKQP